MSLMLDLVAAGVFVADVPTFGACRFTFMNAALAPLAGLSDRAGAGCTLEELFDPDRAACYTKHLHACAASRAPLEYEDSVTLPIQVNGKRRSEITVPKDMPKDEVEKIALADEAVQRALAGGAPKKLIVVPGRIVNVVI